METLSIEIVNPRAMKILKELEGLNLINISKGNKNDFTRLLKQLRNKRHSISESDIAREVEIVRLKRYANKK